MSQKIDNKAGSADAKNSQIAETKAEIQKDQNHLSKIRLTTFFINLIKFSKKKTFFHFQPKMTPVWIF